jgi:hypothetical protein
MIMDLYHIALFLHLLAMIAAAGATTVAKLATGRRLQARTIAEALEWHLAAMRAARVFPAAIMTFVATGGYMLSRASAGAWSTGFVVAGLAGVALLFASGTYLGIKGKALRIALERMIAAHGPDQAPPRVAPPRLVASLPVVNTMLALSVAFVMVTKPASIAVALAIVLAGATAGFALTSKPAAE